MTMESPKYLKPPTRDAMSICRALHPGHSKGPPSHRCRPIQRFARRSLRLKAGGCFSGDEKGDRKLDAFDTGDMENTWELQRQTDVELFNEA